jgi:chromatin assembly factor 1 subunit B
VQGIAVHPKLPLIASASSDRTVQIHEFQYQNPGQKFKNIIKDSKIQGMRMFENEEMNSFFRRLDWSPDGKLLLVPGGIVEGSNGVYAYHSEFLQNGPWFSLGQYQKSTVSIKFCPVWFKSDNTQGYKFVYGVASLDQIVFYDTDNTLPLGIVGKLHYAGLTDFSWSCNGRYIILSSNDGYCSMVQFEPEEFGVALNEMSLPETVEEAEPLIRVVNVPENESIVQNSIQIMSNLDGTTTKVGTINILGANLIKKK